MKQNLVYLALIDIEDQILDDTEIKNGIYFFPVSMCPKNEREAILLDAKKCESVIKEENTEDSQQSIK